MSPRPDPIESMKPADKFLRLGVVASFAFLLLLVTVRSFMDGPEPSAAPQIAQAPAAQETPAEVALSEEAPAESAPAPQDAAPTEDVAAVEDAVEAESAEETTELAEVAPEQAAPVEAAIDDTGVTDWLTSSALLASADIDAGESAFRQCSACHQYASERNAGGPHLVGIVGRAVGSVDNWRYSSALQEAGGIWTPERLNEWLINPDDYLPGNRMAYPGVRSEQERIDIIGFLAAQGQG